MSVKSDLLTGLAEDLDAASVGTWDPNGDTGNIVHGALPDSPDTAVGLNAYRTVPDDPKNPTSRLNVQFYIRAATLADEETLEEGIYGVVHGMANRTYGTCTVTQAISKSSMPMGLDELGRRLLSCNYTFDLDLPASAHRAY